MLLPISPAPRAQRGSILVPAAVFLVIALILLGAVQLGYMFYMKRDLQKAADLAALAGAQVLAMEGDCSGAKSAALASVNENLPASPDRDVDRECGRWDSEAAGDGGYIADDPAAASTEPLNAVRVVITDTAPLFAPYFLGGRGVTAEAVATQSPATAAFSIGSGLLSLNGGVVNQLLTSLLGSSVSLDALSYQGLLDTSVSLAKFLDLLNLDVDLGNVDGVLDAQVSVLDLVNAVVNAFELEEGGSGLDVLLDAANISALRNTRIALGDILEIGTESLQAALRSNVNLYQMLVVGLQAANKNNLLDLGTALELGGLAKADLKALIIEPPKVAAGRPGRDAQGNWRTQAHTAQIRFFLDLTLLNSPPDSALLDISIPLVASVKVGVPGGSTVRIPINLEVATGDAYLEDIQCFPTSDRTASIWGRAGLANVFLGQMDTAGAAANATRPWDELAKDWFSLLRIRLKVSLLPIPILLPGGITLADAYADLQAKAEVSLAGSAPYQEVLLHENDIGTGQATARVGTGQGLGSVVSSTLFGPELETRLDTSETKLLGLPLGMATSAILDPVVNSLGAIVSAVLGLLQPLLSPVFSLVDSILDPLLQALGIQLGYADISLHDLQCGNVQLVY